MCLTRRKTNKQVRHSRQYNPSPQWRHQPLRKGAHLSSGGNATRRHPTPFLCTIALPVHQEQVTSATAAHVEKSPQEKHGCGGWVVAFAGRVEVGSEDRLDPGNLKNIVNLAKIRGDIKPDGHQINHLGDTVWAYELGGQLAKKHSERQVLGRQPYPLTTHVRTNR